MVAMVANGDVVRVWVRGENGELKHRYCVVLLPHPTVHPKVQLLIFCCSETKRDAVWFFRVDRERWISLMTLDNPSTFHAEDLVYYNASSPLLVKKGTCPPEVFTKLKALYQDRLSARWPVPLLPEIPAPPEDVAEAARAHQAQFQEPAAADQERTDSPSED